MHVRPEQPAQQLDWGLWKTAGKSRPEQLVLGQDTVFLNRARLVTTVLRGQLQGVSIPVVAHMCTVQRDHSSLPRCQKGTTVSMIKLLGIAAQLPAPGSLVLLSGSVNPGTSASVG